jgi:ketosteroid isomerase-like protein
MGYSPVALRLFAFVRTLGSMTMKSAVMTVALVLVAATTTGCNKTEPVNAATTGQEATSEAAAAEVADATVEVWKSMDAAKIKALYAPSVEAFDFAVPGLSKDRTEFDKRQDDYAAAKLDQAKQVERKLQVLSPNVFVMSGTWDMSSSTIPGNNAIVRCTDVFQKGASGNWSIVNEHCSAPPKSA